MGTFTNIEDPDEATKPGILSVPALFAQTKSIFRGKTYNICLEIIASDPSIYVLDPPDLTIS